jgi:hypothetical protein
MNNKNLETTLDDLIKAIESITLGSIESIVIHTAGQELIHSWNDHNEEDEIDEDEEMNIWNSSYSPFSYMTA